MVTPLTVFDTNDLTAPSVVNPARLLQTLDTDGNPTTASRSRQPAHSNATGMTVNFAHRRLRNQRHQPDRERRRRDRASHLQDAIDHVQRQLVANGLSLVGTWHVRAAAGVVTTITFLNDGHYLLVQTDPDADESGGPGVEYGTYSWNPTTGELSVKVASETDGEWGLSQPLGKTIAELKSNGTVLEVHDTEDDVPEVFGMNRLAADAEHPLAGTWKVPAEICVRARARDLQRGRRLRHGGNRSGGRRRPVRLEVGTYDWTSGVLSAEICPHQRRMGPRGRPHNSPSLGAGARRRSGHRPR